MDKIQKVLVKAGRKDLAQEYYSKIAESPLRDGKWVLHYGKVPMIVRSAGDYMAQINRMPGNQIIVNIGNRSKQHIDNEKIKIDSSTKRHLRNLIKQKTAIKDMPSDKILDAFLDVIKE